MLLLISMDVYAYIPIDDERRAVITEAPYDYSITIPRYVQFKTLKDAKQLIINEFYEKG